MMLPAATICPPKRLTPSRFDWESRPLRELPPAFLCAMVGPYSPTRRSGFRDPGDLDLGVALPMAAVSLGILAPAQLEGHYFLGQSVGHDFRLDRCALYDRISDLERLPAPDEEHFVEHQFAAHVGRKLLDLEFLPGGNAVLFATRLHYRVHSASPECNSRKPEIIHTFSGNRQRNCAMLTSRRRVIPQAASSLCSPNFSAT